MMTFTPECRVKEPRRENTKHGRNKMFLCAYPSERRIYRNEQKTKQFSAICFSPLDIYTFQLFSMYIVLNVYVYVLKQRN